jgi:uncharacterized protein (TIGR03086 family)
MGMNARELMPRAVESAVAVVDADDLAAPTPCTEFDVRALVNHFAGTTHWLAQVGRRAATDPDDPYGTKQDVTTGDWRSLLRDRVRDVGAAWAEPSAWEGTVEAVQMQATMIGEMALVELLVHGWDLASATGQQLVVDDEVGAAVHRSIAETAELGQQMGAYGPEIEVPSDAPAFDRALGLAGRDPLWKP